MSRFLWLELAIWLVGLAILIVSFAGYQIGPNEEFLRVPVATVLCGDLLGHLYYEITLKERAEYSEV